MTPQTKTLRINSREALDNQIQNIRKALRYLKRHPSVTLADPTRRAPKVLRDCIALWRGDTSVPWSELTPFELFDRLWAEELALDYRVELYECAHHEVGHAVQHVVFGIAFKTVEIFTDEYPGPFDPKTAHQTYLGQVTCKGSSELPHWAIPGCRAFDTTGRAQERYEQLIAICLSGELAQAIHLGPRGSTRAKRSANYDRENIREYGKVMCMSPKDMVTWVAKLRPRVLEMLQQPVVLAAINAVADELVARAIAKSRAVLKFPEVQEIVARVFSENPTSYHPLGTYWCTKMQSPQAQFDTKPRTFKNVA